MEQIYKTMSSAGRFNLIAGICVIIISTIGCVCGSFMIVHGAKLISKKKEILF